MSEIDVSKCPAYHLYNVFGIDSNGCCYLEHKYCNEVDSCNFKYLLEQLKQLKSENEELKDSLGLANKYANNYKATLDEIVGICDFNYTKENTRILANEILQLIKQVKEGWE